MVNFTDKEPTQPEKEFMKVSSIFLLSIESHVLLLGQWVNGLKNGAGKYTWTDGRIYKGEFRENKIHGMGMLRTRYGDTYIGMWEDNLQHGKGKYIWKNGSVYKGDFVHGNQVLSQTSLSPLVSSDAEQHGIGRLTTMKGEIQEGVWVEGVFSSQKTSSLASKDELM
jgi:hypothetical protein